MLCELLNKLLKMQRILSQRPSKKSQLLRARKARHNQPLLKLSPNLPQLSPRPRKLNLLLLRRKRRPSPNQLLLKLRKRRLAEQVMTTGSTTNEISYLRALQQMKAGANVSEAWTIK
jgi:hypothetical protein